MFFWAHTGKRDDEGDWQPLPDHLHEVARRAEAFGRELGLSRTARLAGLFHDLGKYHPDFQRRLKGDDLRIDHSTAGAAVLLEQARGPESQVAELVAYTILGHHAGLPDKLNETHACLAERLARHQSGLDPAWRREVPLDFVGPVAEVGALIRAGPQDTRIGAFDLSVAVRMLFSCLVDADFKDTEAFYAALGERQPDRDWPALPDLLPAFRAAFEEYVAAKPQVGELNALRREILAHVRAKAAMAPGLFTLTVPTGGGKTLASLGFALDHAARHGHRRIIYAIPFTSIIDQTAVIFRDVLGAEHVLEHHSAIDAEHRDHRLVTDREAAQARDKLRLAMEDWAVPVVVTTNVQFFESLFAARPSRARKLHNIAGAVVILDEAQTIPRPLLRPCMRMLDTLARHFGCTIVLCTATQPALGRPRFADGLDLEGRELAPNPEGLAARLRRARIVPGGEMDDAALVAALRGHPQALVIVNSRAHALNLWRAAEGLEGLVHLSTRQCAVHRRQILAHAKERLAGGLPCRVIATSLIEAGVDISFPRVWRAEAGLDQIVQAAGRCNREGTRPLEESVVTVFSAPDHPPPAEIKGLIGDMGRMLTRYEDLLSLAAIEAYFREVYWRLGKGLDGKNILDRLKVERTRTNFAFRSVAADFRMIESSMVPVVIPWNDAARSVIRELGVSDIPSGSIARKLQSYVVQVPEKAREQLRVNGKGTFACPELRGAQFFVLNDSDLYQDDIGLWWEDAEYLNTEQSQI